MTPDEAANILANVCGQWRGSIADGKLVEQAYLTLVAAAGADPAASTVAAAGEPEAKPPNRTARRAKGPTKARPAAKRPTKR